MQIFEMNKNQLCNIMVSSRYIKYNTFVLRGKARVIYKH